MVAWVNFTGKWKLDDADDEQRFELFDDDGDYAGVVIGTPERGWSYASTCDCEDCEQERAVTFKTLWGAASALLRASGIIIDEPSGLPQEVLDAIAKVFDESREKREAIEEARREADAAILDWLPATSFRSESK